MSTGGSTLLSPDFLHRLEQIDLVSRKIFQGKMKGERRSKRKGRSVEFADYRNYVIGDDLRFLDWNLYARLDRLFIRLFLEEEDLHFYTLIDNSLSMGFGDPSKLRYALQIAAALAFVGLVNMDRVKLYTFNDILSEVLPAMRGRRWLWRMLDTLDRIEPSGGSNLERSIRDFCLRSSGKGIAVVLSDFMDKRGYEDALRYLVARDMDVYAIQVLAPEETDPEMVGDLKLIDVEDEDAAEITVSAPLLKRYKQTLAAFRRQMHEFCTRRGIVYLSASTRTPFEELVLSSLRRRGMLR